jgi:hypothetical protein
MKKMMMAALVAGVLAATSHSASAQSSTTPSLNMTAWNGGGHGNHTLSPAYGPVMGNSDISAKALRHFSEAFAGVTGVRWSVVVSGYMAQFAIDGVVTRDFYDAKGNWRHTIKYYDGKKLASGVSSMVRSVYYDYAILSVQEIKLADKTVYLVNIEGDKKGKTIRVCGDEMEPLNEYDVL